MEVLNTGKTVYVKNNGLTIELYQPDYTRKDLITVACVGDLRDKQISSAWSIEPEILESQKFFSMIELKKHIEENHLKECADFFNAEIYLCTKDYVFYEYKLKKLKKEKGRKRNDWLIEFWYKCERKDKGAFYHIVYMLPDGKIIIESSNTHFYKVKGFVEYSPSDL